MAIYDTENILTHFRRHEVVDRSLVAEEVLFRQGAATECIYFVVEGEVRIETILED